MRYFIIINPPQYRDNSDDLGGYAWAGEAESEDDAKAQAIAECEASNGWGEHDPDPAMRSHTAIDADDTDVIECGPDYRFLYEELLASQKPQDAPPALGYLTLSADGASVLGQCLGALTARLDTAWEDQTAGESGNYYDPVEGEGIRAGIRYDRRLVDQCREILGVQPMIDLTIPPSDPRKLAEPARNRLGLYVLSAQDAAKEAGFAVRMMGVIFHLQYPDGQVTRGGYTTEAEAWDAAGRAALRLANGATMQGELPHAYRNA